MRPSSYLKIDNFYTATVYEKGAEVIRMLKTLLGEADFRRGMDLYFERLDGTAATVEQFVECFAEASGRDLSDLFGWYEQAGTPTLTLEQAYDAEAGALELTLRQQTAPTPGQPGKTPLPIPVRLGLINENGGPMAFSLDGAPPAEETVVVLDAAERRVRIEGLPSRPAVSALRGFSARHAEHRFAVGGPLTSSSPPTATCSTDGGRPGPGPGLIIARSASRRTSGEQRFVEATGRALAEPAPTTPSKPCARPARGVRPAWPWPRATPPPSASRARTSAASRYDLAVSGDDSRPPGRRDILADSPAPVAALAQRRLDILAATEAGGEVAGAQPLRGRTQHD